MASCAGSRPSRTSSRSSSSSSRSARYFETAADLLQRQPLVAQRAVGLGPLDRVQGPAVDVGEQHQHDLVAVLDVVAYHDRDLGQPRLQAGHQPAVTAQHDVAVCLLVVLGDHQGLDDPVVQDRPAQRGDLLVGAQVAPDVAGVREQLLDRQQCGGLAVPGHAAPSSRRSGRVRP
jgi:hypothetical protein